MRFLFLTVALMFVPSFAQAESADRLSGSTAAARPELADRLIFERSPYQAQVTARQLVYVLQDVSYQARNVARNAEYNGRYPRAQKFRQFARKATQVSNKINRNVLQPLYRGATNRAKNQLQWMQSDFRQLNYLYNSILQTPPALNNNVRRAKNLHQQLKFALNQGPGYGQGRFQCTAVDRGWEEHRGGHKAIGQTQRHARIKAIRKCEQAHGHCYVSRCDRI